MREILFKAKRIDNGEWVEGTPIFYKDGSMTLIDVNEYKSVGYHILNNGHLDRNTLCQYTGLTDKNGNKIWENDIVEDNVVFGNVVWDSKYAQFMINDEFDGNQDYSDWWQEVEVIGNIFDNQELVKGGAE